MRRQLLPLEKPLVHPTPPSTATQTITSNRRAVPWCRRPQAYTNLHSPQANITARRAISSRSDITRRRRISPREPRLRRARRRRISLRELSRASRAPRPSLLDKKRREFSRLFAALTVSRVLSSKTAINLRAPSPTRFGEDPVPPLSIAEQALLGVLLRIGFTASLCYHKSG